MTERIILKENDVVSISDKREFIDSVSTLKAKELKQRLYQLIPDYAHQYWFNHYVACEVLLDRQNKWMKGRARLVVEFIPEKPEKPKVEQEYVSPLDDLRKELNL